MKSPTSMASRFPHLRRIPAACLIVTYLLLTAFYLGRHAIGDSYGTPLGYFWTWDMFPNYPTESVRRLVVGETAGGRYVQLVPNSGHRFRWGVHNNATRFEIDHRLLFLRRATINAIRRHNGQTAESPVRHVYVVEKYWPPKFNLSDDLYRSFYRDDVTGEVYWASSATDAGKPKHTYWRILEEAEVVADGHVIGWEPRR